MIFFYIRNSHLFWYQKLIFWYQYQKINFWYQKLISDIRKSFSDIRKSALKSYLAFHIPPSIAGQIRQNTPSRIQSLLLLCIGLYISPNRLYDLAHSMWYTRFKMNTHCIHYNDVIMSVIASQITSLTIVYSTVYSGTDQRKHQSSA